MKDDIDKARLILQGNEMHPLRRGRRLMHDDQPSDPHLIPVSLGPQVVTA
jgi:hypothetical protein